MSRVVFNRAFQELTDEEIKFVMENARVVNFEDGEILIREGEDAGIIMVILDGSVKVVRLLQDGREKKLTEPLIAGDTVGEMSFIDGIGASATLIASGSVTVKSVDMELVEKMAAMDSGFKERLYHSLLLTVIRRLRVIDYQMAFPG